jgi:SAM-dependent methyltransferase
MGRNQCSVCGGETFVNTPVLWPALINEWQLDPTEVDYIDRQQGERCAACGSNLRSIALANSLRAAFGTTQWLQRFCASSDAEPLKVLEINEAGDLHGVLRTLPNHHFGAYPDVDMHALPFPDDTFDVVTHSDTLEHLPNPVHALTECRRVLRPGGVLCFTVPIVVGRLSRSREGLARSFHGNPDETPDDFAVHTEFGADAWTYAVQAGFRDLHFFTVEYPAAIAISATKAPD